MNSPYYLRKRIVNDDYKQDRCLRELPFSAIYPKTAENLPKVKEFHAASLLGRNSSICDPAFPPDSKFSQYPSAHSVSLSM
ncbi:hypothetical protein TNCV_4817961 [Trichonephila clavipes]|nr:hypothetical protein TNCV_4817961 [Trichonephila clavipes]